MDFGDRYGGTPAKSVRDLSPGERLSLTGEQYAQLCELGHARLRSRRPVGYHLDLLAQGYQKPPHDV